ncbi:unnamed protein product [Aureobasidium uvarum]|uniref:RING-type domain-containing protein n=1 Tax=Aureobasidium uvarum TaxID=2773716 RepID=A0A9N8KMM6_9PEZI|nr:unnamed protein product [Aureobasidium uvarum]
MDISQPAHGVRQHRPHRRTLLTLRTIRSLFRRIQHSVRSHLHLPLQTTGHTEGSIQDTITRTVPVLPGGSRHSLRDIPVQQPFAIGTFVMSSSRSTRRAAGQGHRLDESSLEHAVRRSRRVAGESPESGPYRPPPRRPPRQEAAYRDLAQPETSSHPPPPSSTFTFSRPDPPVPSPGFSPATLPSTHVLPDPAQPPHVHPPSPSSMTNPVNPSIALLPRRSSLPAPAKLDKPALIKAEDVNRECDICCEANRAPVLQPCRLCTSAYCGDCIRSMFLEATRDSTSMPPRCCTILSTIVALDFLSTAEADEYRLKFEEWVSTKKTYCPVPQCSRFIPDRAVLPPPSADSTDFWAILKPELPAIMTKLQQQDCARYLLNAKSPEVHGINWKCPGKMVWLEDISAKFPSYSNMVELDSDLKRLSSYGRTMPQPASASADVLRRHLWKEIGKVKVRVSSKFAKLPASACFSCPGCHIGICPSCKQVAHFGQPCDTAAQDHELAMLETYGYKKCPRCGHGVKRMYGCRHMQCRCGAHWCWGCLRTFDECACDSGDSDSEDEVYSDEETDPDTPQTSTLPQGAHNGGQNATVTATAPVPAPGIASAPGRVVTPANQSTNASADAVRPGSTIEPPINLDAGGRRVWEAAGAFFGEEPEDGYHVSIWACAHVFRPAQIPEETFKRGVPLSTECFRCFFRTYATVQRSDSDSSSGSQGAGVNNHKHAAEEDVAWRCGICEMSLCGVCKNDVISERGL